MAHISTPIYAGLVAVALVACGGPAPAPAPAAQPPPAGAAAPGGLATAGAAVAAPSPAAATRAPAVVRITDIQIAPAAGSDIAAEKGYFEEEGIRAEFVPVSSAEQFPAMVAGQADAAGAAIDAFLLNAFARGLPVKIVADHGANLPGASAGGWATRKDLVDSGAYQGPGSVRGWKVGLSQVSNSAAISLERFLRGGGLRTEDVEIVLLPFPDQIPAFANGAIDGAYWQEPFTTIAVERGLVVRGPLGYDVYPYQQIAGVLFGEKLLSDRALAVRHLRAYTRGVRDYVKAMI